MSVKILFLAVILTLGSALAQAGGSDQDIPLAVTGLAHPSLLTTPTVDELKKSDEYLRDGLVFLKNNLPERALSEFKDSVRLAPRAENYKALGTAYYQVGDPTRADWAYRQSLQLRPDAQVQALIDSLEGKDHPEEQFKDVNDQVRFDRLRRSAASFERRGKHDSAIRDYADAYALKADPAVRKPIARIAASLVEDDLKARAADRAIEVLVRVRNVYANAKDMDEEELGWLERLDRSEAKVVKLTGEKLREHEVDMQTDKERWRRKIEEIEAKKGGTHIQIEK
jgi:tetratricopeptide (TPR) repeat protein